MTTPRQYTDTTDSKVNPPERAMQQHAVPQTDEYAGTGQHVDTSAQQQFDPSAQHVDPSAQQQFDPSAQHVDPSAQHVHPSASSTPARMPDESDLTDGLFGEHDLADLRNRWNDVQAGFVDDPRECVQRADGLVSSTVEQLTASFAQTRSRLEDQWSRGEEASTEDLRIALKRYRDFFDRLLAV